ncbi:hypothetical protein ACM66B_002571 [Microbotryomycetes sp. NB124-2]
MAGLKLHHVGILLLLASLGLLLTSISTVPLTHVTLFKAKLQNMSDVTIGMWGYCIRNVYGSRACNPSRLGYGHLTTALEISFGSTAADATFNRLTYGLVMHVIAAIMTLFALVIAVFSHRFGFLFASLFAVIAWVGILIALAIDLAMYLPIKSKVEKQGGSVSLGVGIWTTDVAAIVMVFATLVNFFSMFTARRNKQKKQQQAPIQVYQPLLAPMASYPAPQPFVPAYQYDKVGGYA